MPTRHIGWWSIDPETGAAIAAWGEPEAAPSPFRDRRQLLETILATMEVWPASLPFAGRIDPSG